MEYQTILYAEEGGIATITLNRPDKLNAISDRMLSELDDALGHMLADGGVRALILTGAGRGFSAGGDVEEIRGCYGGTVGFQRHMEQVTQFVLRFAALPLPVIAAVNGTAAGAGANFALACDFVIVSEKAKLSQIFSSIGLVPDWGGTYFLPRLVGLQRAKELIYTGRMLDAAECLDLGLALQIAAPEALMGEAHVLAERLAARPTAACALSKVLLNRSTENDLRSMLDYEGLAQITCAGSEDYKEGMAALAEKRTPVFQGR